MEREPWKREELYKLVWSRPMTDLAKEYGISDVGLHKVCVKLNIPLPTIGHWRKVRTGQVIKPPPLPPLSAKVAAYKPAYRSFSSKIANQKTRILDTAKAPEYLAALAYESDPINQIMVDAASPLLHPEAVRTLEALQKTPPKGALIPSLPAKALDIRVSGTSASRAVAIADSLLSAFEKRGWTYSTKNADGAFSTQVQVFGVLVKFWIEEIFDRIPRELTPDEVKDKEKHPWNYSRPVYDMVISGRLSFGISLDHDYLSDRFRSVWSEGIRQRLDYMLNSICRGIVSAVIARSNGDIERAREKAEYAERERLRAEAERRRLIEEARFSNLTASIKSLERMRRIQALVAAVRERATIAALPLEGDLAAWLSWAESKALQYDPFKGGMPKYDVEPAKPHGYMPWDYAQTAKDANEW